MYPAPVVAKAKLLRSQGHSYGQLVNELHIPKSTLHLWIHGIKRQKHFTDQEKIRWAKTIQPTGARANHQKRLNKITEINEKINQELSNYAFDNSACKAMLAMLYWAEGSKGRHDCLTLANTDPTLHKLYITLLRQCYPLNEGKFRLRLHLHYYHNENVVKSFWSNHLNLPLGLYQKTYWKPRNTNKRFRQNQYGICFVRYYDIYLKEELLRLGVAIADKISSVSMRP